MKRISTLLAAVCITTGCQSTVYTSKDCISNPSAGNTGVSEQLKSALSSTADNAIAGYGKDLHCAVDSIEDEVTGVRLDSEVPFRSVVDIGYELYNKAQTDPSLEPEYKVLYSDAVLRLDVAIDATAEGLCGFFMSSESKNNMRNAFDDLKQSKQMMQNASESSFSITDILAFTFDWAKERRIEKRNAIRNDLSTIKKRYPPWVKLSDGPSNKEFRPDMTVAACE